MQFEGSIPPIQSTTCKSRCKGGLVQICTIEGVLAGKIGTHSVCVCVTHQNAKLMPAGGRVDVLTKGEFRHYTDCLVIHPV